MTITQYKFSPITNQDLKTLHHWLSKPHVSKFWGEVKPWVVFLQESQKSIESDMCSQFMVSHIDEPFAFIQYYWANKVGNGWWPGYKDDVVGIDLYIGEEQYLGKGHGNLLIQDFIKKIVPKEPISQIICDPRPDNLQAIRCYQRSGFLAQKQITTPDGVALLMSRKL